MFYFVTKKIMGKLILYELIELDCEGKNVIGSVGFFKTRKVAEQVRENVFQTIRKKEIIVYNSYKEFHNRNTNKGRKKNIMNVIKKLGKIYKKT